MARLDRTRRAVALFALALALFTVGMAHAATTVDSSTFPARGLKRPAEILIDKWGVPHIYARSADDAFFAQGFNAARDRLFQIDLWRRRGLGELAAVFGPAFVEQDRAARLFLYRGDMRREWAAYGPDAQRIASRFVAGINAYVDWVSAHPDKLPIEFRLLHYTPARWKADDVVRIRSHGLTRNLTSEVARANTVCKTDRENGPRYDEIRFGLQPPWQTSVPNGLDPCLPKDVLKVFTLATQNVRITKEMVTGSGEWAVRLATEAVDEISEGSNNWVIAPAKSATGRPILANDPHRAYSTPSLRYIAHLNAPGMSVIGAGEPSLPGISIGHNGTIAFGLTIFNIDQEDLYVYDLDSDGRKYRYRGDWQPLRVVREPIAVKGAAPVLAELVFTREGPVIYTDAERHRAYAVRSCWLEPGMSPYFGSVWYMRATSFREFQKAMLHWGAPTENQVYADVGGNIGWIPGGLAPIRPNWDGLFPVPGDGHYEWQGFWPGDKLPWLYNPPSGYITTSNEMNLPPDYPYRERKLGFEWTNGSRHARLDELMRARDKISIEDSMQFQNDITSIPARRLVALVASLGSEDAKTQAALDLLRGWNGAERADSPQAALLEVWSARFLPNAFRRAVLPKEAVDAVPSADIAVVLDTLEAPQTRFAADAGGTAEVRRDKVLLESLAAAYAEMEKLQGSDAQRWQWGKLHHSLPEHPLASAVDASLRDKLQPARLPKAGGPYTPNQSTYRTEDFRHTNGPSFRMVLDVGQWDNSRAVNYPGQSGDPDDPHYADLRQMWLNGEYFPLLYTRSAIESAVERRIVLTPAK